MACFIVPAAEAVIVTAVRKAEEKKEQSIQSAEGIRSEHTEMKTIPLSVKLKWLGNLLLGGVILLLFEHIWHGEVVPWFPFLTAMADPGDTIEMLHEMASVGVTMAVLITLVWIGMCFAADSIMKRTPQAVSDSSAQ